MRTQSQNLPILSHHVLPICWSERMAEQSFEAAAGKTAWVRCPEGTGHLAGI